MPKATLVVPAYNVSATIGMTLKSLLSQSFPDFEIIVVDDGSQDDTVACVQRFYDPRLRLIRQKNRGLAGAHNTGIAAARGEYIGFCDADDMWLPEKLARHVAHLDARPEVGISFSGSELVDAQGAPTGLYQSPRLTGLTPAYILQRNPIGNGSAPVMRKAALESIRYRPADETERDWWFDETFRQSDDIEGWARFAATTDWLVEGIPGALTLYRVNPVGLSANVGRQLESWERMLSKLAGIAPALVAAHGTAARAFQLRYLCRRAIASRDAPTARRLALSMLVQPTPALLREPVKSLATLGAALTLTLLGVRAYGALEQRALGLLRSKSPSTTSTKTGEFA